MNLQIVMAKYDLLRGQEFCGDMGDSKSESENIHDELRVDSMENINVL